MYGLINNAMRNMIVESYGEPTWDEIHRESGVIGDPYLAVRSYDDSVTYDFVGAAAKVLDTPAETCLELFGEYWILKAAPENFSALLDATGADVLEFFENLNELHDRITTTFVDYLPPTFIVKKKTNSVAHVDYISTREGLTPFVVGIIRGVSERFSTPISIRNQKSVPVESGEHTVFELEVG